MFIEFFSLVFSCFVFMTMLQMLWRRRSLPPGPFPLPLVGNLMQFDPVRPHVGCQKLAKIYGPVFTVWLGHNPAVMITDYDIMKEALIKHADQLSSRPRLFSLHFFTRGNYGIVMSSGDLWKEQRRFSLHVLRNFGLGRNIMEEKIMFEVKKLSQALITEMGDKKKAKLDLTASIQFCVTNIIAQILIGRAFEKNDKVYQLLQKAMNESLKTLARLTVLTLDGFPWLRHLPIFGHFGTDDLRQQEEIITGILSEQISNHKANFDENKEPSDFIDAYLKEMHWRKSNSNESYFSDWQLKCILGDLFAAGMETTATTVRWAILAMVKFPEIQRKVHEEIDSALGRDKTPTMADRLSLPYVVAVINEVQRWANIIPINIYHASESDVTVGGYKIPKDVIVIPQISVLAIDEKVFHRPEKFDPSRFLEQDQKTLTKVEQFAPFSLGKRQCLGEGLARAELFLIFVHLMQRFQFSIPPGEKEPTDEPVPGFTLSPYPHECLVVLR